VRAGLEELHGAGVGHEPVVQRERELGELGAHRPGGGRHFRGKDDVLAALADRLLADLRRLRRTGIHLAHFHPGYLDGAIEAGGAAAEEPAEALARAGR
jgi:hypothetical protein